MSKYTAKGSPELDQRIDADMQRIAAVVSPHASAGVLMGGYGRGEGTPFIHPDGSQTPFNDYDLVVVADKITKGLRKILGELEIQLTMELGLPVDLCPYREADLPKCEFSLLNYEMKYGHMVVWGSDKILNTMPDYSSDTVPLSEGTRLLMNRGKLLLDIKERFNKPEPLNEEERIRFIKFIFKAQLALGDAALLDTGRYDISYRVKKHLISHIGDVPRRGFVIDGYLRAIELKEWGDYTAMENFDMANEFEDTRLSFVEFFNWYHAKYPEPVHPVWKTALLNQKWLGCPLTQHPRTRLYDALPDLLSDHCDETRLQKILLCRDNFEDVFYRLQKRFS